MLKCYVKNVSGLKTTENYNINLNSLMLSFDCNEKFHNRQVKPIKYTLNLNTQVFVLGLSQPVTRVACLGLLAKILVTE